MQGKVCVITGATSGIGQAAAVELARRGADVAIVCRDPAKGEATVAAVRSAQPAAGAGAIEVFHADLSVLAEVRSLAVELRERIGPIDVLVNNAGINAATADRTVDGFDRMVATNHLGPFLLTNLVLDRVEAAAPARIVNVASEAHRAAAPIDLAHLGTAGSSSRLGALRAYGRTKLMNILFTQELARRLDAEGVTANALCPGFVATDLAREDPLFRRLYPLADRTPFVRTPEQGAAMTVRLATDPDLDGVTGRFFTSTPGAGLLPDVKARHDESLQRDLWDRSAELVQLGQDAA